MKRMSFKILAALFLLLPGLSNAQCSDLFFSEYIEGSSSNKAMEVYNPTSGSINLSDYVIYRNNNGSLTPTDSLFPRGILNADSVYVFANPSANAAILAQADTTHTLTFYNGDDAVWIKKISTGDTLDIIGVIGVDPGSGWIVGTGATNNFTLVRSIPVLSGQKDWSIGATEWDVFPIDMADSLGFHTKALCAAPLVFAAVVDSNVTCNGLTNGGASVTISSGTPPYTYMWSNMATTFSITGVTAGKYLLTVTDSVGNFGVDSVTIVQPSAIVINVVVDSNVSCNGQMNGGLTATATGGTGIISYLWSAGNRNLAAQSFESTTNDNWNFVINPATYNTEGDSIVAGSDDVWAVIQEFTGSIDTASNGLYFWGMQDIDNGNGGGSFYHTMTFNPINVSAETGVKISFDFNSVGFDSTDSLEYQVMFNNGTSWDSNGVALNKNTQAWSTITVDVPDSASFVRLKLQAKQNGASDYAAFDNIKLFTGSSSITGLGAGTYTVTATDSLGCTSTATGTITESAILTAALTAVDATTIGGTDGYITTTVSGGTAGYTYAWSNMAMTDSIGGLNAGTYTVTITDANGCTVVVSATVSDPAAIVLVMDSTNVSCFGAADGTAKVVATGGSGTYSYMWSNMATTDSIGGLSAGTYVVTVSDLVGTVTAIDSIVINEPSALQLSLAVTNASATSAIDGAIDLTVTGGTPGFTFNWSNAAITEDLTLLAVGTYSVTVTDANGCQIVDSAAVLAPGVLANLVITEINYNGPESGTDTSEFIEVANAGSTAINLNGFSFSQGVSHTFTANDSITAGQYFVIAYDSSAFRNVYGINANAIWNSGGLSNGGEDITLVDNFGRTIDSVDYENSAPWPVNSGMIGPVGNGTSIELQTALTSDNNDGSNWVASALAVPGVPVNGFQVFGSPGNPYTTGISTSNLLEEEIRIYPNPSKGMITIQRANDGLERIQIISLDGKVLNDIQSAQRAIMLDLSDYSNGVYFLRIGNETQKIILSR
ncbi:MAG: hypothetical protein ACJASF_001447 [Vicingaceae bacterium]|jgi:hypothetical protein